MSQKRQHRRMSEDLTLEERRSLIWELVKKTQLARDPAAWKRQVAVMRKRAQLQTGEPGQKRTWTRDDLYEERLSRFRRG